MQTEILDELKINEKERVHKERERERERDLQPKKC